MQIFTQINQLSFVRPVVTLGFFDGVHIGHRQIIKTTISKAKELNRQSLLITFWPHPRIVLNKDADKLRLLSSLVEKQKILSTVGVDGVLVMEFTPELASQSAENFAKDTLIGKIGASSIVLGFNHVFGHMGRGNFDLLKSMENEGDFCVHRVDHIMLNDIKVSSTKVRDALERGKLHLANQMLDSNYSITGTIKGGKQIGRSIGYPTANISPSEPLKQIPGDGVYAVWVDYQNNSYPAMLNIGRKPTVQDGLERSIEAHIIGFKQNIYNQEISVRFIQKIREEIKFPSLDALKEQLAVDKVATLKLLEGNR